MKNTLFSIKKLAALTVILILIGVSWWAYAKYQEQLSVKTVGFELWSSETAWGFRPLNAVDTYYTVTPYDDLVILSDGSEQKFTPQNVGGIGQDVSNIFDRLRNDLLVFRDRTEYVGPFITSNFTLYYSVQGSDDFVAVTRTITNKNDVSVVGLGKSILFNTQDRIFFDQEHFDLNQADKTEKGLIVANGISTITLASPFTTHALSLPIQPADQIIIDPKLRLLTIKSFFTAPTDGDFDDYQLIEIVENPLNK